MLNKKSQEAGISGYRTIVMWALIIAIGVVLFLVLRLSSEQGQTVWERLKEVIPFI